MDARQRRNPVAQEEISRRRIGQRITIPQLYAIFAIYGAGFVAMSLIIVGLNLLRRAVF